MRVKTRMQWALALGVAVAPAVAAATAVAACQSAAPAVGVTPVTTAATPTASPIPPATATAVATTVVPETATTVATVSPFPSATTSPTTSPAPASATLAPTEMPSATAPLTPSATSRPTFVPATAVPSGTPTGQPQPPPLYGATSGPAGYSSRITCQRAGGACAPVMAAGDLSFSLVLASDASAPWTHFVNYGLAVEKDSVNAADLFMFVDAGWLQPGEVVGFGASRNFSQPGVYVIRSSGCMTTDAKSNACVWQTIGGTVVTFRIE